jgi:hypothetical protein
MAVLWSATAFWLIIDRIKPNEIGNSSNIIYWLWIASSIYFFTISVARTISRKS